MILRVVANVDARTTDNSTEIDDGGLAWRSRQCTDYSGAQMRGAGTKVPPHIF